MSICCLGWFSNHDGGSFEPLTERSSQFREDITEAFNPALAMELALALLRGCSYFGLMYVSLPEPFLVAEFFFTSCLLLNIALLIGVRVRLRGCVKSRVVAAAKMIVVEIQPTLHQLKVFVSLLRLTAIL